MDIIVRKNYATPFFLREPFDTEIARVGHCNRIIEALNTANTNFTALDAEVTSLQAQVTSLQAKVDALPAPFTLPYKVYTALLSQSGTSAPVATVLENNLGGTVVWTRDGAGQYTATLTGKLTANKTVVFVQPASDPATTEAAANQDGNTLFLHTLDAAGIAIDNLLRDASIEIKVYT